MTAVMFASVPAAFSDDEKDLEAALKIQKQLQETIKTVTPAFVFFGRHGSAVCISEDGFLITNNHVADFARRFGDRWNDFYFAGGKRFSGTVIWYDRGGDLALCKLDVPEGEKVPFRPLGDSDALAVGDHAIAVGNPFSLGSENWEPSVSLGIISATRRYKGWYSEAIQTDASVNPGNSGGPLFNSKGEVVGINGMIEVDPERGRVSVGVGYAIPSNQIKRFIERYKGKFEKGGVASHGTLTGLNIDQNLLGRPGAKIADVVPNSPAEKAGFKAGDVITAIENKSVLHPAHVLGVIHTYPEGSALNFVVEREGKSKEIKVTLETDKNVRDPNQPYGQDPQQPMPTPDSAFLGVGTAAADGGGLDVSQIVAGSPAEKAGIKVGDRIVKIDGTEVNDPNVMGTLIRKHKAGDKIKVTLLRGGKETEIEAKLEARGSR
jgi:serine protease Do